LGISGNLRSRARSVRAKANMPSLNPITLRRSADASCWELDGLEFFCANWFAFSWL
jgi:hypothetical protein